MVSEVETTTSPMAYSHDRGFIPEETVVVSGPNSASVTYYRPFWRPVMAGTFFAFSVFVLSWFLMLGFHVGLDSAGVLSLGVGAAIWLWVTACVAYFFGGMIASAMTSSPMGTLSVSNGSSLLKGAVIWGVSIPLAMIIYGFVARSGQLFPAMSLPHPGITESAVGDKAVVGAHIGFYWSMFIGLALALIFSLVGSVSGCSCRKSS